MKISEIGEDALCRHAPDVPVIGLDIGSRGSKGVLLTADQIFSVFAATGLYMQETADELLAKLLGQRT